jgi:hypothetical protein
MNLHISQFLAGRQGFGSQRRLLEFMEMETIVEQASQGRRRRP